MREFGGALTSQGEGAIEGSVEDYEVNAPFDTEFRFGRFGKAQAPPRNVTKLNAPAAARRSMKGACVSLRTSTPQGRWSSAGTSLAYSGRWTTP
mgnify:CR=1 FL=1